MVWRSPEPSWWPIASLVSLMCTHRWTRPTQWTNVAHRVVLRKGSSRLLFFPPTLHSLLHSLISTVSPSSSIFRRLPLLLLSSPFWLRSSLTSSGSIFLGMLVLFFFFSFLHSYVAAYFFALLSLIVPNAPSLSSLPFFISFAYDIAASFCPPPVVRTFSAFKSMSFYQCSSRREGEKDFGLSCVFFFFYKLNVIIFDFFFVCSFRVVKTIWEIQEKRIQKK